MQSSQGLWKGCCRRSYRSEGCKPLRGLLLSLLLAVPLSLLACRGDVVELGPAVATIDTTDAGSTPRPSPDAGAAVPAAPVAPVPTPPAPQAPTVLPSTPTGAGQGGGTPNGQEPQITTCEQAVQDGRNGDPCALPAPGCEISTVCCRGNIQCIGGQLVRNQTCGCVTCQDDLECSTGADCVTGRCSACSDASECVCPVGWENVVEGGCRTCDCVPQSTCVTDQDCTLGLVPGVCVESREACVALPSGNLACARSCATVTCFASLGVNDSPQGCGFPCNECPDGQACMSVECTCTGQGNWFCERTVCTELEPPC